MEGELIAKMTRYYFKLPKKSDRIIISLFVRAWLGWAQINLLVNKKIREIIQFDTLFDI